MLKSAFSADASAASAKTQYVQLGNDRIAFRAVGQGSPVVLANRMRGTLDTWDPLFIDTLAQSHTVITFDYPGIGYSEGRFPNEMSEAAGLVRSLAEALGLQRFAMGGWSWGGLVAQTTVLEAPEAVTHGLFIATNPPGQLDHPIQQRFLDRALKPVNDLADEEVLFFEPASARSLQAARESHERIYARSGVVDRIPSRMEDITQYLKASGLFHKDEAGRRDGLTKVQTPILVLGGDNDPSTAVQNWYPLIGKIPRGQLIVLPESGHAPQHQYPVLAARYIQQFLALGAN